MHKLLKTKRAKFTLSGDSFEWDYKTRIKINSLEGALMKIQIAQLDDLDNRDWESWRQKQDRLDQIRGHISQLKDKLTMQLLFDKMIISI